MTKEESSSLAKQPILWLGLFQGLVLYALYKTHQEHFWSPGAGPVFNILLLEALLLPFVVYWSHGILDAKPIRRLLLSAALVIAGLAAYQAMTVFPIPELDKPQLADFPLFFGMAMVSFMTVPLLSAWGGDGKANMSLGRWDYALLFEHSWRNAVITVQAGVLTCLFWIVLELGAQLFNLIGIEWPKKIIEEPWFAIPVTTTSIALGIRAGLRRAGFTITLRNHWLNLTAWLLPIVSLIGAAFALSSLAGVGKLFERGLSAFFLLWFAAFWIKFFNSAYQDGHSPPPFGNWMKRILSWASLGLLVVAVFAAWALVLRINQHGLTPDRVWGMFVALVALCYGIGYPLSLVKGDRWMARIADANVVAALLMCGGILLLLSPVLDARKLAVNSQMSRLHSGTVTDEDFDVHALTQQGSHGHSALSEISAQTNEQGNPTHSAVRAREAIDSAERYRHWDQMGEKEGALVERLETRVDTYPVGRAVPADFYDFLSKDAGKWNKWQKQESCFESRNKNLRCSLLQLDLDRDGKDEVVLWKSLSDSQPWVYSHASGQWKRVGMLQRSDGTHERTSVQADLYVGEFESQSPAWNELRVGKARYHVNENVETFSED